MRITSVISRLVAFTLLSEKSASATEAVPYPQEETLESIGYGVFEIIEREEAFAIMMKDLIGSIMPIGHQTALVSSEILTLAAIADVSRNIFDNLEKLHRYNLVADAMLKATIDRIKEYADKETDLSIEGASGIGGV
jgi:hypothetical protein